MPSHFSTHALRSGDWLYHLIETTTFICVVLIIYLMKVPLKYTHNIHHVCASPPSHS